MVFIVKTTFYFLKMMKKYFKIVFYEEVIDLDFLKVIC